MRAVSFIALAAGLIAGPVAAAAPLRSAPEPLWAYGYVTAPAPPGQPEPPEPDASAATAPETPADRTRLRRVEGSDLAFSKNHIHDYRDLADWFPGDHPPLTPIMVKGPAKLGADSYGCAYCHLPTGKGRPENAPVAGQSAAYLLRQLEDFRNDARTSADRRKPNTVLMTKLAKAMTEAEIKAAAAYFAATRWTPWTQVIETDRVPETRIEGNLFRAITTERTEPIAGRIIEVPIDEEQANVLRNPRSGFIAYVPIGSLRRGADLVATGGAVTVSGKTVPGRTVACASCHGPDLMGLGDAPGIAGRSPSYLARQLYDFQQGTRRGKLAAAMQPTVAHLTGDDLVDIAAYVASLR